MQSVCSKGISEGFEVCLESTVLHKWQGRHNLTWAAGAIDDETSGPAFELALVTPLRNAC